MGLGLVLMRVVLLWVVLYLLVWRRLRMVQLVGVRLWRVSWVLLLLLLMMLLLLLLLLVLLLLLETAHAGQGKGMGRRSRRALPILVDRLVTGRRTIAVLGGIGLAGRGAVRSIVGRRGSIAHRLVGRAAMMALLVVRLARRAGLGLRMGHGRRGGRE